MGKGNLYVACFTQNRSHDQESCKFAFQRPEKSTRRVGLLLGPLMPLILLCLAKILSSTNAFEISDIQEDETEAALMRRSGSNNVTFG